MDRHLCSLRVPCDRERRGGSGRTLAAPPADVPPPTAAEEPLPTAPPPPPVWLGQADAEQHTPLIYRHRSTTGARGVRARGQSAASGQRCHSTQQHNKQQSPQLLYYTGSLLLTEHNTTIHVCILTKQRSIYSIYTKSSRTSLTLLL